MFLPPSSWIGPESWSLIVPMTEEAKDIRKIVNTRL
jgi:hypothetical protein